MFVNKTSNARTEQRKNEDPEEVLKRVKKIRKKSKWGLLQCGVYDINAWMVDRKGVQSVIVDHGALSSDEVDPVHTMKPKDDNDNTDTT